MKQENPLYHLGMAAKDRPKNPDTTSWTTKWMNKDGIRKPVPLNEINQYLNNGWKLGSASTTCKGKHWTTKSKGQNHWYTNGIINVQAKDCPLGFKPGRIIKQSGIQNSIQDDSQ